MNISELSTRRPVTVLIAVTACVLFGFISLSRIGLDLLPEINLPMTAIVTVYPNADPETVERTVSAPIERALRSVRNIKNVTSTSVENVSIAIAEFNWGSDLDAAQEEVRTSLDTMKHILPEGVQTPIVSRLDPSQLPVLMITVGAAGDIGDVTRRANEIVKPAIERAEGVAGVSISGGADRVICVEYEHEKLVENGLSPLLLQQLITFQNLSVPAGVVVDDGVRYQTRVGAKFSSADDVADLVVGLKKRTEADGQMPGGFLGLPMLMPQFLTVGDIADVYEGFQTAEGYTRINGTPAVALSVYKQSGENTVTVTNRVRAAINGLKKEYPDISLDYVFDQSQFITKSINDLAGSAALGAVLAVAVLYLFLRHVGCTLIIGVSIPLSIVFTFVLMYAGKLTVNLMTLGGLALGVGMLVDNSIVVLESVFRRQELGDTPLQAAIRGAGEVGMAITASTLTTVAVFVPVVFVRGLAGAVFKDLALTVTFSLLASLVVALTVVPLMASIAVKVSPDKVRKLEGDVHNRKSLVGMYDRALKWSLANRGITLGIVTVALALAVFAYPRLGQEFLKPMDMGSIGVTLHLPAGTPVEVTNEASLALESELVKMHGVQNVTAQVGSAGSGDFLALVSGNSANTATVIATLRRQGKDDLSVTQARNKISSMMDVIGVRYPELTYSIDTSGYGSMGGGTGEYFGGSVTLEISGPDSGLLSDYAGQVVERIRTVPGFVAVRSSVDERQPAILLDVNRTRALMGGVTVGQIGLGVRTGMLGTTVTYVERGGELIPVVVKPASGGTPTLDALLDMPVSSSLTGSTSLTSAASGMGSNASAAARTATSVGPSLMAPPTEVIVGRVVSPEKVEAPMAITRRNGRRYVTVTASYRDMKLSEAGRKALEAAKKVEVAKGYDVALGGVNRVMSEAFSDLGFVVWLAIVLVYMVMAVQYESLFYPFIILFTMPLAVIGAVGLLWITGETVNLMSIIGLIVLAGIVVNNGIVLIDFINQLRAQGMATRDAVLEACRARIRPILMTALTTILGLVPMALKTGNGSELERPLAITVIGGLTTATFLTLFVIPIIYELMDGLSQRFGRKSHTQSQGGAL